MTRENDCTETGFRLAEWPFPLSAALGSDVRAAGIERELRARLPWTMRKHLAVASGKIVLRAPVGEEGFEAGSALIEKALSGIEALPVLPREAEDILSIKAHERQKWIRDGRIASAGTRTVKLRGRAKAVTFHVFDPRHIEDLLDRDAATIWRQEDAESRADARRRAAAKAASTRAGHGAGTTKPGRVRTKDAARPALKGWDAFASDGLLR